MGESMGIRRRVRALVAHAMRDLELGERYEHMRDDAVASVLYQKARERVLKALFMVRMKRNPPANVSLRYLEGRIRMPADISAELSDVEVAEEDAYDAGTFEQDTYQNSRLYAMAKNRVASRYRATKRLIYYAMASMKA
jgi:hypothetical protein